MVRTLRKNDYMTVLKQKCSCLPHKFIIFRQWETQHMDKLAYKHDWQKIHSVSQRSFIWSFKIPRIETQQINQFPQTEFLLPSVQIIQVLCIHLKKLDRVVANKSQIVDIRSPCDRNLRRLLRDGDYWLGHDIIGKLHLKQVCISIPYTYTFIWSRYMPVWKNFVPERFLLFNIDWFFHWLIDSFSNDIFLLSLALSCWDQSLC